MVRPVRRWQLVVVALMLAALGAASSGTTSHAQNGNTPNSSPPPIPIQPSTDPSAYANDGQLAADVQGTLAPIPPNKVVPPPSVSDPVITHAAGTSTPRPLPPSCTAGSAAAPPPGSLAHKQNVTIYPTFTRNASGGYDGSDPNFGYYQPNAIPPGGDPTQTQLGAPATAANIAGHVVGVPAVLGGTLAADGSCFNGDVTFGTPFLARDYPPSPPTANVRDTPPFGLGPSLLAQVSGRWRIGTIDTLPGPGGTTRTFVHIPTCTWLDSTVPLAPQHLHAIKTAQSDGYTFFLVYNVTVTPGPISWDWGDGTTSTNLAVDETPPATLPAYDPSAQTWNDPCTTSHPYATVNGGRTITATQKFTVDIRVSWSDGVSVNSDTVPCDGANVDCAISIGPAQGWQSGPHPVDQIEPIPFSPQTGG